MANYVLEILDGDRAGEVLPVSERALRIGRKAGNDIVIADEKTSGVHCEIVPEGDRLVLRDLGSTNGTFLDGKRVTEIVLTPGDVVTVGRTKVKFRSTDTAAPDAGELTVRRLDATRLKARGGSLGLVAGVVVLALLAAGWFWWQSQDDAGAGGRTVAARRTPLDVPGNRLGAALANCEAEQGWDLRAAGTGFQTTTAAHTGTGAFTALAGAELAAGDGGNAREGAGGAANDASGFAVLRLAEPLPVLPGRAMTIAGHCRTSGGARIGVRAVLFSSNEQHPFRFTTGTRLLRHDDWQRVEAAIAVPAGCDRLLLEAVALLPEDGAEASVDDLAVTEGGGATAVEHRLAESGQTLFGTGSALAVRSTDLAEPATLLQIVPDRVAQEFAPLAAANLCVFSDVGAQLAWQAGERAFDFTLQPAAGNDAGDAAAESLQLVLPAEAASGVLAAGADGQFESVAAASEFVAQSVLLGDRATRTLFRVPQPRAWRGRTGAGVYRLAVASPAVSMQLGFLAERQSAAELVRTARSERREGRPGAALDHLEELLRTVPMDTEQLQQAVMLRGEILAEQDDALRALRRDFEEAEVFRTRGGFERVADGLERLKTLFGEGNLEDAEGVAELQQQAMARLAAIDGERKGVQRDRLEQLAKAFEDAEQEALARLVKGYVQRHLGGN